jgi:hypothetical protein
MANRRPGSGIRTDLPDYEAVSFDIEAFDQLIVVHGVEMVHYRAMRCPVGLSEMYDSRRPHDDHTGCSNGFIYKEAGVVTTVLMSNGKTQNLIDTGIIDNSTVQAIFPVHYDHDLSNPAAPLKACHVAPFDRFYLRDDTLTVIHWQLFEANQTGHDRLHFPVVEIEHIIDASGYEYGPQDYQIDTAGSIVWKGAKRPGFSAMTGKGEVCSIRYRYRPYWYVDHLLHEIRVARAEDATGERVAFRMPYSAMLSRERFFENEEKDDKSALPNSLRQVAGPASGGFGPR